jgi:chromosome segregation ATPase
MSQLEAGQGALRAKEASRAEAVSAHRIQLQEVVEAHENAVVSLRQEHTTALATQSDTRARLEVAMQEQKDSMVGLRASLAGKEASLSALTAAATTTTEELTRLMAEAADARRETEKAVASARAGLDAADRKSREVEKEKVALLETLAQAKWEAERQRTVADAATADTNGLRQRQSELELQLQRQVGNQTLKLHPLTTVDLASAEALLTGLATD